MKTWDNIEFGDKLLHKNSGEICLFHEFSYETDEGAIGVIFRNKNYVDYRFFPEEFLILPEQDNFNLEGLPLVLCDEKHIGKKFKCCETGATFKFFDILKENGINHYRVLVVNTGNNKPENLYFAANLTFKPLGNAWLKNNINDFESGLYEGNLYEQSKENHAIVASKLYLVSE